MDKKQKLIPKRIGASELDSVKTYKSATVIEADGLRLLDRARIAFMNMENTRMQRARNYRMVYGDQWGDTVTTYIGGQKRTMTMREYLAMDGQIPVQANQLFSLVNTLVGVVVKEQNEPVCNARDRKEQQYGELLTVSLQANNSANKINKIDQACLRDAIIGGLGVAREHWGYREGGGDREDSWTTYIDPDYFIMETTFRDPRMWDATMIGIWHEIPYQQLYKKFVKKPGDIARLHKIFGEAERIHTAVDLTEKRDSHLLTFMTPTDISNVCVAEIWTLETKERVRVHDWNEGTEDVFDADDRKTLKRIEQINAERKALAREAGMSEEQIPLIDTEYFIDEFWYCRFIAPDGTIIDEYESPYPDRQHPFIVMAIPFNNGRISAYITDSVDLNIMMNRAYVLQDWIARNQVKGFTMIPKQLVPDGMTNEEFVQGGMNIGNFFFYDADKAKGYKPEVFHTAAVNYDATAFAAHLRQLMDATSGVSGAIQGKTPHSGTSAALYAQQTSNASTAIAGLLSDFRDFMTDIAIKKAKNIAAFYDRNRFETIAGSMGEVADNANMNLARVADFEFDIEVKQSTETPVFRAIQNDQLMMFWQAQAIDLQTMLEVGNFPFGDELLQKLQARQAESEAVSQGQQTNPGQPMENPVQTQEYGLPVQSTRPIVNTGL